VPKGPAPFGGRRAFRLPCSRRRHRAGSRRGWSSKRRRTTNLVRARDQIDGGFVQYVHADDLALGEKVVGEGACGTCHGADYKGTGDVPRAGRATHDLPDPSVEGHADRRTPKDKNVAATKPIVANLVRPGDSRRRGLSGIEEPVAPFRFASGGRRVMHVRMTGARLLLPVSGLAPPPSSARQSSAQSHRCAITRQSNRRRMACGSHRRRP